MTFKQWLYFGFTGLLVAVLAAITGYMFHGKRKDRIENPKFRMLDGDEERDKPRR